MIKLCSYGIVQSFNYLPPPYSGLKFSFYQALYAYTWTIFITILILGALICIYTTNYFANTFFFIIAMYILTPFCQFTLVYNMDRIFKNNWSARSDSCSNLTCTSWKPVPHSEIFGWVFFFLHLNRMEKTWNFSFITTKPNFIKLLYIKWRKILCGSST